MALSARARRRAGLGLERASATRGAGVRPPAARRSTTTPPTIQRPHRQLIELAGAAPARSATCGAPCRPAARFDPERESPLDAEATPPTRVAARVPRRGAEPRAGVQRAEAAIASPRRRRRLGEIRREPTSSRRAGCRTVDTWSTSRSIRSRRRPPRRASPSDARAFAAPAATARRRRSARDARAGAGGAPAARARRAMRRSTSAQHPRPRRRRPSRRRATPHEHDPRSGDAARARRRRAGDARERRTRHAPVPTPRRAARQHRRRRAATSGRRPWRRSRTLSVVDRRVAGALIDDARSVAVADGRESSTAGRAAGRSTARRRASGGVSKPVVAAAKNRAARAGLPGEPRCRRPPMPAAPVALAGALPRHGRWSRRARDRRRATRPPTGESSTVPVERARAGERRSRSARRRHPENRDAAHRAERGATARARARSRPRGDASSAAAATSAPPMQAMRSRRRRPARHAGARDEARRLQRSGAGRLLGPRQRRRRACACSARRSRANPLDSEVVGNLAFLQLKEQPPQAEAARQLALHSLALERPALSERPDRGLDGLRRSPARSPATTPTPATPGSPRWRWPSDLQRQCNDAVRAEAIYGERLRPSVQAMLQRARSSAAYGRCEGAFAAAAPSKRIRGGAEKARRKRRPSSRADARSQRAVRERRRHAIP